MEISINLLKTLKILYEYDFSDNLIEEYTKTINYYKDLVPKLENIQIEITVLFKNNNNVFFQLIEKGEVLDINIKPDKDNLEENKIYIQIKYYSGIIIFNKIFLSKDDFKLLVEYLNIIKNTYTADKITKIFNQKLNNLEDIEKHIVEIFLKEPDFLKNIYLKPDILKSIETLIIKHKDPKITEHKISSKNSEILKISNKLGIISKVFQFDNKRLVLINTIRGYVFPYNETVFNLFDYTNLLYNYLDSGRYVYLNEKLIITKVFEDFDINFSTDPKLNELVITNLKNQEYLIKSNHISFLIRKINNEINQKKQEQELKLHLENKIKLKIEELKNNNKELKINKMIFTKNTITYEDQLLKIEEIENWTVMLLNSILIVCKLNDITFDTVLQSFSNFIEDQKKFNELNLVVGNLNINYKLVTTTNNLNVKTTKKLINGYRINNNEVAECIEKAMCFKNIKDYNNFLKNISTCSLKIHHYLNNGIKLSLYHYKLETINLIIPLIREKNKYYIYTETKKYPIKDINKLISLEKQHHIIFIIEKLLSILDGVSLEDINSILKYSKNFYLKIKEQEEKHLKEIEKLFNLNLTENIKLNNNIEIKKGYIIKGKIRTYCIDAENDNKVFSYPGGTYLCIIDKDGNNRTSRLINRIYALHNDHLVVNQIYTLTDNLEKETGV